MEAKTIEQKKQDDILSAIQLFRAGQREIIGEFAQKQGITFNCFRKGEVIFDEHYKFSVNDIIYDLAEKIEPFEILEWYDWCEVNYWIGYRQYLETYIKSI